MSVSNGNWQSQYVLFIRIMQFFGPSASIYCPGAARIRPNATIFRSSADIWRKDACTWTKYGCIWTNPCSTQTINACRWTKNCIILMNKTFWDCQFPFDTDIAFGYFIPMLALCSTHFKPKPTLSRTQFYQNHALWSISTRLCIQK